jgi:hypothetical protein
MRESWKINEGGSVTIGNLAARSQCQLLLGQAKVKREAYPSDRLSTFD